MIGAMVSLYLSDPVGSVIRVGERNVWTWSATPMWCWCCRTLEKGPASVGMLARLPKLSRLTLAALAAPSDSGSPIGQVLVL